MDDDRGLMGQHEQPSAHDDDALADITVLDRGGNTVHLTACWSDHAAVLVFVRHFG